MKQLAYRLIFGFLLFAMTIGGLEAVSYFFAPSWPAYDARPVDVAGQSIVLAKWLEETPELIPTYNSWAFRDRDRQVQRPDDVRYRVAFVGDSNLEGVVVTSPLSVRVERDWIAAGYKDMEAINLGVAATGPSHYYYRTREIALELHPDLVVLVFSSGTDFVYEPLSRWDLPPLIDERPLPSVLGTLAPHFTWLLVNRLGLSEFGRGNKPIPGETDMLAEIVEKPRDERVPLLARHLKRYYFPDMDEAAIREVLSRGGNRLWDELERRGHDREVVAGWWLAALVQEEILKRRLIIDREDAQRQFDSRQLDATMTWLEAIDSLVKKNGATLLIVLAPVGTIDPRYAEFYKPWPHYNSWNIGRMAGHERLAAELRRRGMKLVDLQESLQGVPGTHRLLDGHWTELGTEIAARRIADEILAIRGRHPGPLNDGRPLDK